MTSQEKSFLASWKFWLVIVAIVIGVITASNMDPTPVGVTETEGAKKLRETREEFYKSCMGTGSYYATGSDEYNKMEESCRKGMNSISTSR